MALPYRVNYHALAMIYLQPDRELSGSDFARLWSGMSIFGKVRGAGGFWHRNAVPDGDQRPVELGSLDMVQPLLEMGKQHPIFGGGSYARRVLARNSTSDSDFYYAHAEASRWMGGETLPYLLFSVSGQWFEQTGVEVVLEKMREHFEVADAYEPAYGLIDLSVPEDSFAGLNYGSIFYGNSRVRTWVEQAKWVYVGSKRRDQARGVYWGNYFGRSILDRLGGREKFLESYRREAQCHWPPELDGSPNARIWEFKNGIFVSICLDPLGCKPGAVMDGVSNLLWLIEKLGSHGVLCPWQTIK